MGSKGRQNCALGYRPLPVDLLVKRRDLKRRMRTTLGKNPLETSLLDMEERAVLLELDQAEGRIAGARHDCCHSCARCCRFLCCNVGFISIVITVALLLVGVVMLVVVRAQEFPDWVDQLSRYIISAGLFGVASGGTNAIAVIMLLYKIPLVCGSGVFNRQHRHIRNVIKLIVLQLLFNSEHLQNYISKKIRQFSSHVQVTENITQALNDPEAMQIIKRHLDLAFAEPEAQFLKCLGLKREQVEAMVRPAVLSLCAETAPYVLHNAHHSQPDEPTAISVPRFRKEMDHYLTWRVEELTQERTGQLMRELTHQHLGWVVAWGCLLGTISGIITQGVRISINFNFI